MEIVQVAEVFGDQVEILVVLVPPYHHQEHLLDMVEILVVQMLLALTQMVGVAVEVEQQALEEMLLVVDPVDPVVLVKHHLLLVFQHIMV